MDPNSSTQSEEIAAYLEHYPEPGGPMERIAVRPLPFEIGRSDSAHYTIYSTKVSKRHVTIYLEDGVYRVRDHGSTNGTFVNGDRIAEALLTRGDILHVADKEFSFCLDAAGTLPETGELAQTAPAGQIEVQSLIRGGQHLREMLTHRCVSAAFQPIVVLQSLEAVGYEVLLRGTHSGLSPMPAVLFQLAEQCRLAGDLSRLIRTVAAEDAHQLPPEARIFLNLHPAEMTETGLIESLHQVQEILAGSRQIVVEVSEAAVTDLSAMRAIADQLKQAGIGFAYDDFGAGQARLMELVEVPPDYLKLDIALIRDIDTSPARRGLVQAFARVASSLGIQVIAEGIETQAVADICQEMGCQLGQGYLFGRPQSATALLVD